MWFVLDDKCKASCETEGLLGTVYWIYDHYMIIFMNDVTSLHHQKCL